MAVYWVGMSAQPSASLLRTFGISALITAAGLLGVLLGLGLQPFIVTLILGVIEITFSFDNAILNAKILGRLSARWQMIFLTAGILVAIFGMRIVFPLLIVVLSAHLGWGQTVDLALHHPQQYAQHLESAHPAIAAFGGVFLLLLALGFFIDRDKDVHWLRPVERFLTRLPQPWSAPLAALLCLLLFALLPANAHSQRTLVAGFLGAATFLGIDALVKLLHKWQGETRQDGSQTGLTAFATLVYLEILDASFSFDGVIGAFAITTDVILIAIGLGIGAHWVRSLTVFMTHRGTLDAYRYLEHGAHYTIVVLALILLISISWDISDFVAGILGIFIIGLAIAASVRENRRHA